MYFTNHLAIGWQLLRREWYVFTRTWRDTIINSLILTGFMSLLYGYFLPTLGMPYAYRIPLFLGTFVTTNFTIGYNVGMMIAFDLQGNKILPYHLSLPLSSWLVIGVHVISTMMQIMSVSLPLLIIGLLLIGGIAQLSVSFLAPFMLLAVALFFALFFLTISMGFSLDVYFHDAWPRFLAPLFAFGSTFYTWKKLAAVAPQSAQILLYNPVTYCVEGVRASLLAQSEYLLPFTCLTVVLTSCVVLAVLLMLLVRWRLNPVQKRRSL